MYIAYINESKRVISISNNPFSDKSSNVSIAEVKEIPSTYDYLLVDNIRVETRTVNGKVETYTTCDLLPKFYEYTAEQLAEQKERKHKELSKRYIRQKYPLEDENKIMRRYLASPSNPQYKLDFLEYNEYVEKCILRASEELNK
jgi:hypothetical protein